jgi:hypothetical protein
MWCGVDIALIDVSEERIASIFRVEKSAGWKPEWAGCVNGVITGKKFGKLITTYKMALLNLNLIQLSR